MKKLLFLLVLLLMLGGGGAGAYFYFNHQANASVGDTEEHQAAAEADSHGEAVTGHHEYVELDPLILPIIDGNGVSQVVSLVVTVEVGSAHDEETVKHYEPRLKDAYIQELYGVLNKRDTLKHGVVQVSMIKKRLQRVSNKVMGDDMISDVLIQVVQQREM